MPERPGCIPPGMVGLDPEAVPLASLPTSFPHGEAGEKAWGSPLGLMGVGFGRGKVWDLERIK